MAIGFKKVFASFLLTVMIATTASAQGGYTHVQAVEEYYNASSPVGTFAQYPAGSTTTYSTGYIPVSFNTAVLPSTVPTTIPTVTTTAAAPQELAIEPAVATTTPTVVTAPVVNGYAYAQPMPATYQQIEVPQNYDKKVVTTNTYVDQRETIDKVIDRSGKIVGIVGVGALLGLGVAALINSF